MRTATAERVMAAARAILTRGEGGVDPYAYAWAQRIVDANSPPLPYELDGQPVRILRPVGTREIREPANLRREPLGLLRDAGPWDGLAA